MRRFLLVALAALVLGPTAFAVEDAAFDERLAVFLADMHVNGLDAYVDPAKKGKSVIKNQG